MEKKSDRLIWWLMASFAGLVILLGSAWANSVSSHLERLNGLGGKVLVLEVQYGHIFGELVEIRKELRTLRGMFKK